MTPARARLFRVALALGKTVQELTSNGFSYRELLEWEVYLSRHPTTAEVVDWQMASMLNLITKAFGGASGASLGVQDWSLYERLRPRTPQEQGAELRRKFGIME